MKPSSILFFILLRTIGENCHAAALRIEYPGACYHVICRGKARLPVFLADVDKELLPDRMAHFAENY